MDFYFFDLDGTLEDSRKDMVGAVQRLRAKLALPTRDYDQLVPHVNKGMRELYVNCFNDYIRNDDGEADFNKILEIERLYEVEYGENIAVHTQLYAGIQLVLEHAKKMGRTAVITNKPERLSKKLLSSLSIDHLVDLVVGGDTCAEAKPSAVPLRHALTRLGGNFVTDRVFMIGDSQGDSKAGAACGATTVWCAWGYQNEAPTQPPPQHVATNPQDLLRIFSE